MTGRIQSLLVGINNYPSPNTLNGCVGDVEKFKTYLANLGGNHRNTVEEPETLLNEKATKTNIVNRISEIVEGLSSDDVFLLYYSGHGAQQLTGGKFLDDYNGLHQCLVCYHQDSQEKDYLLADKEIRYLFNLCKNNAHIVAIFDCCHSGEITRSINNQRRPKRITDSFTERPRGHYIFHDEVDFDEFKRKKFKSIFPDTNVINLSASLSNQFSWEDANGGVFTRALLGILNSNNNHINYNELIRQSEIAIRLTTDEKQTPNIDVLGNRRFNHLTSWLRLNGDELRINPDYISYNKKLGWVFTKGSLMGFQVNDKIKIKLENGEMPELELVEVNLDNSVLEDTIEYNLNLDKAKTYAAVSLGKLPMPKIFINNIDNDKQAYSFIEETIKESKAIILSNKVEECDYELNIFNQQVYFSFPYKSFQPINKQFDLVGEEEDNLEKLRKELQLRLKIDLETLVKGYQICHLNMDDNFLEIPVKIEAKVKGAKSWIDITNGNLSLDPKGRHNQSGELYNQYEIRLTNISDENIYVTTLVLIGSNHEISAYPFDERTVMLKPDSSVSFDNIISLDNYQELYNWDCERVIFKFLVNNHSDLTKEIPSFTQVGFEEPLTLTKMGKKGAGSPSKMYPENKNAVYTTEVQLLNTSKNQITGLLRRNFDRISKNELIQPFIERLYFEVGIDGLIHYKKQKPSNQRSNKEVVIKGGNLKMNIGNLIDYNRRNRKFKKLLKQFPEKPIIVAEGDSWFLYPILVKDTLDYVMESWPLKSLAWAGDTLENYKKSGQLLKYVKKLSPKFVFISGGGNDIIGSEIQQLLKKDVLDAKKPMDYLNDKFEKQMDKLEEYYSYFFTELIKYPSVDKIVVHGYDYVRADHAKIVTKGGWINKYLENAGIHDYKEREKLIKFLIDKFNTLLERTSRDFEKVTYLNLRGLIDKDEWFDEIHPNDEGYKKVADRFLSVIN